MFKNIEETDFAGKRVIIRVDYNVPLDKNRNIIDDRRIISSFPTLKKVLNDGGIPIIISHLGRPDGIKNNDFSLKPIAKYLEENLKTKVLFIDNCMSSLEMNEINTLKSGEIALLENIRFYSQEENNDENFANSLSKYADMYINDAFGTAHRAHASTHAIASKFAEKFVGKLMEKELTFFEDVIKNPNRPFTAIIGGAKISGKIDVIKQLYDKCDNILLGGGMIFTFFKALGLEIGKSIVEIEKLELAKSLISSAIDNNVNLLLPVDVVVADRFNNDSNFKTVNINEIPNNMLGLDIGVKTVNLYLDVLSASNTILWNGPLGVFEMSNFEYGTFSVAKHMAELTKKNVTTIIGGGDSAAAIKKFGLENKYTHVSTGGGASLELLEGKHLPGIEVLRY